MKTVADILREAGIHPSAQRLAIGEYVLHTAAHPSRQHPSYRPRSHSARLKQDDLTLELFRQERRRYKRRLPRAWRRLQHRTAVSSKGS